MQATGRAGELRFRYQVAALLGEWTLKPVVGTSGHRFRLEAKVAESVDPWASRRPLDLRLIFGRSIWVWRGVETETVNTAIDLELDGNPTITKGVAYVESVVR